jgi:hypothetical protein
MHQEFLDNFHNTLQGFDGNSSKGLLFMLSQLLDQFHSRAEDVANWPNVCLFSHPSLKGATDRDPLPIALF